MKPGTKVKIHYTGTLSDGEIFDSSEGKEPLEFTIGNGEVISGFENGIKDMKLNEEKTITIKPEDAYGESIKELIRDIPRDKFPPKIDVGGRLVLKSPEGQSVPAVIIGVKQDAVTIDLNHPLAGKELNFNVKVVGIN